MLTTDGIYVSVISARRPQSVLHMQTALGKGATWYVGEGEGAAYTAAGATRVVEAGALTKARNAALEDAFKSSAYCLQLSDDLIKCHMAVSKKEKVQISLWSAVLDLKKEMEKTRAKLGGVAPTANEFYFNPKKPVKTSGFIVGDFLLVAPSAPRFDENLKLKEDYQLCLDHLMRYSKVCRVDRLLVGFKHRSNPGGAVSYRTEKLEQETIQYLKHKYKGMIKDNPRRPNEILLAIK